MSLEDIIESRLMRSSEYENKSCYLISDLSELCEKKLISDLQSHLIIISKK